MREVILAKTAGFCFGVRRAVQMAEKAADTYGNCFTLGPIIHNEHVVRQLREKGVREISDIAGLPKDSTVIIRSHGVGRDALKSLIESGARVIDATCPDVAKIHKIVADASERGRVPVIIGERNHPEVTAICAWCDDPLVFQNPRELSSWLERDGKNRDKDLTVVFQTTGNKENMKSCAEFLKKECTSSEIFDTICSATSKRQAEAAEISKASDAMIVIGGRNSANSLRLAEICGEYCDRVFFVESADELNTGDFDRDTVVGIIAGASAPAWIIKEVYRKMSDEILRSTEETPADAEVLTEPEITEPADTEDTEEKTSLPGESESFEELLEKSIKTLHTGEKVTGIVAAVSPSEISVDLGTKQSGYIPISELSNDPDFNVEELVQVGGEVETYVMRVNDVEGTVMLSKKRLDTVKNWDEIEKAKAERRVVEGVITEDNKGGVVASVKGVRVFIPASQTGIGKDIPMASLKGQRVKLRITEINASRRRVVGSVRLVRAEERKELAEKTWAEIEEGKRYTGVVKSLTSYGAFVDIGGVDGMVHVSELSWSRVKSPSDVFSPGDEVSVYVLSVDREKGKISLGYKDPSADPWKVFTDSYEIGSEAKVKVVKLMPFGAFAEIVPGVDGLIHISQIADHRIGRPDELLSIGQEIQVMILDIDNEKKNISLSIRALVDRKEKQIEESASAMAEDPGNTEGAEDAVVYDTDVNVPEPAEEAEPAAEDTAPIGEE